MTEKMIKGLSFSELKKEDLNKLKKWKEEEYSKIGADIRGPKNKSKRSAIRLYWISDPK